MRTKASALEKSRPYTILVKRGTLGGEVSLRSRSLRRNVSSERTKDPG